MKIAVHAVGRMKAGPERELADRYLDRFARAGPPVGLEWAGLTEMAESRAQSAAERAGVGAAHRDRHPPDDHRDRIGAAEHALVRDRDPRAGIEAEREQAPRVRRIDRIGVHRGDPRALAGLEGVERHAPALA